MKRASVKTQHCYHSTHRLFNFMRFSKAMYSHWHLSPCMGNLEKFPPERSEKWVFIIIHYLQHFYRMKVLNSHLQGDDLYAGWFHWKSNSVLAQRAANRRRVRVTACWHSWAPQSDGWQENRRTLLLIESSQNSHSNMEKPNYKTDTRCLLFFPTCLDSILEKSNVELSHLLPWLFFSTVEIHKCSSEVIDFSIAISHPNRKQWLKIYKSFFFFQMWVLSPMFMQIRVPWKWRDSDTQHCWSSWENKLPGCELAPRWLQRRTWLKEGWWYCRELWSGAWRGHTELQLLPLESDAIVLDCDPTSAEDKCTSVPQIRTGPSGCRPWLQCPIPPSPL